MIEFTQHIKSKTNHKTVFMITLYPALQISICSSYYSPFYSAEIEFIIEMRTSRAFRVKYGRNCPIVMRGRFLPLDTQLTSASPALTFVAFCAPIPHGVEEGDNMSQNSTFQSQHTLDMKIAEMTEK